MTTAAQTRAIHSLKKQIAGFEDDDYRALLQREFDLSSSRLLSERQAIHLIDILKGLAGQRAGARVRTAAETADGRYAPILRALWIGAYNLGIARSKDDRALIAFVTRQTGLSHTRFLNEPADAAKAIEGLKKWMGREGGVAWPKESKDPLPRKRALVEAIARRLVETGGFTPFLETLGFDGAWPSDFETYGYRRGLPASFSYYQPEHFDRLANWLGARLRAALAKKREAA